MNKTEPSMYAQFIKEREGRESVEFNEGFYNYTIVDNIEFKSMYVPEFYVKPEYRKTNVATDIGLHIEALARELGCNLLVGTVGQDLKYKKNLLNAYIGWGFQVTGEDDQLIYIAKEL